MAQFEAINKPILTDLSAVTAQFLSQLCEEHIEEATFLHCQCKNILQSPSWNDAIVFEQRLEAHIEALLLIGSSALEACRKLSSKNPADLYVMIRLYYAAHALHDLTAIIIDSDMDNEGICLAIQNALVDEGLFHPERKITLPREVHNKLLAGVYSNLRIQDAPQLMGKADAGVNVGSLRIPGRLFQTDAVSTLEKSLDHNLSSVRSEAALSLLRLGHYSAPIKCCKAHHHFLLLGIAGNQAETEFFLNQYSRESMSVDRDLLLGLGLSGDIAAIPVLIQSLSDEVLSEWAALALELITGAGIEETVFIPDELDEDELFENEIEKLKNGEPLFPPGQEPGIHITRITQDKDQWQTWYQEHSHRFKEGIRYRDGHPCCPKRLIQGLKSSRFPAFLRQLFYEELVIRYSLDFTFETTFPATVQIKAIEQYETELETGKQEYQNGLWYFAGQPMK